MSNNASANKAASASKSVINPNSKETVPKVVPLKPKGVTYAGVPYNTLPALKIAENFAKNDVPAGAANSNPNSSNSGAAGLLIGPHPKLDFENEEEDIEDDEDAESTYSKDSKGNILNAKKKPKINNPSPSTSDYNFLSKEEEQEMGLWGSVPA